MFGSSLNVPMETYRVIGIRPDGSRMQAAESLSYGRATQIKAVLIGSNELLSVTIEREDSHPAPPPEPEPLPPDPKGLSGTQRGLR